MPVNTAIPETQPTATDVAPSEAAGRSWRQDTAHLRTTAAYSSWYVPIKRVTEFLVALCLLVLAGPVILVCAALVKLTSRGSAFYTQTRLGRGSRPFRICKLRTMRHDCEKASGVCWATVGDPRVTLLGRFLRKTHLDELPQLWNVLKGDMSLVGPRPERPEFVPMLQQAIPGYLDRLEVLPGVTGLAQVQLPADTDLESVRRKLNYDLYYISHLGPWLDFRLILCTALRMVGVPYHKLTRWFAIPSGETIETASRQRTHDRFPINGPRPAC